MTPEDDPEQLVPISVRLGAVVPPEDPEDWTRPLTWVAAIGMLLAPALALAWFVVAAPTDTGTASPGTYAVAIVLAAGAAVAGATQLGRALTGTLGAGLLAALVVVIAGAATAGERQMGAASPTLAHAVAGALAGLGGVVPAAVAGWLVAGSVSRLRRGLLTAALGALVAAAVLPRLF